MHLSATTKKSITVENFICQYSGETEKVKTTCSMIFCMFISQIECERALQPNSVAYEKFSIHVEVGQHSFHRVFLRSQFFAYLSTAEIIDTLMRAIGTLPNTRKLFDWLERTQHRVTFSLKV